MRFSNERFKREELAGKEMDDASELLDVLCWDFIERKGGRKRDGCTDVSYVGLAKTQAYR